MGSKDTEYHKMGMDILFGKAAAGESGEELSEEEQDAIEAESPDQVFKLQFSQLSSGQRAEIKRLAAANPEASFPDLMMMLE